MIKINNDVFYLSAGETCYIFKTENGELTHTYFGKRVEPEDDLDALGIGENKLPEFSCDLVTADAVKPVKFVFEHAEISDEKPDCGSVLCGGKTLSVTLSDRANRLKAHLYYTPYPRGGYSRNVVIQNDGTKNVTVRVMQNGAAVDGNNVVRISPDGKIGAAVGTNNGDGVFIAVTAGGGNAYGFLCAYADGKVRAKASNGAAVVCYGDELTVPSLSKAHCPELLTVYSDAGLGGMTRVLHDILRDGFGDKSLSERCPAVLFLPKLSSDEAVSAVRSAYGMGFGIVAVDGGLYSESTVKAIAAECKDHGMSVGLRISGDVQKGSMLYGTDLLQSVKHAVKEYDIKCVTADVDLADDNGLSLRKLFALKYDLTREFTDLRVDFGVKTEGSRLALAFCYPLGCIRNIVSLLPNDGFKQRFDCATMGALGYEFDPNVVSDGIKLAVRAQMLSYQDDALTVMRGDIYRQERCLIAVSKDKSKAYAVCKTDGNKAGRVLISGIDEHNLYHVRELGKTFSGAALKHCGISLPADGITTHVLHIIQVADFF